MAAGLGFKTFTTGEVLTANDTNGYLMQGVLVFASSAARASAITSPQEGQYSYLKDTNSTEYYDGAAWIAAPIGDITGVTAGTGISGGGTSGTVTITNSMATEITAAGDIIVGTGSGTFDNLPIGTTAQVLTADTTVSPYKVKWATPAATTPTFVGVNATRTNVSTVLVANTNITVAFTTEEYDTNSFHDNTTNNSRVTIPSGYSGKYQLSALMNNPTGTPGGYQYMMVYKNGSQYTTGGVREGTYARQAGAANQMFSFSQVVTATAGDYFELQYAQNNGETVNLWFNFQFSYLGA